MTDQPDRSVPIRDMLEAIEKAEAFVNGMTFEEFRVDEKTNFAVIRALEILGEAAKNVPPEVRDTAPVMPWRTISGMRDKLIHAYAFVDLGVVWRAVREELPPLEPILQATPLFNRLETIQERQLVIAPAYGNDL